MSRHQPCFWNQFKRPAIISSAMALLSLLIPLKAPAQWVQSVWTVEIDVTHQGTQHKTKPTYSYKRTVGSCADSPSANPLNICDGDTVQWVVKSNHHKDALQLLLASYVLADSNGKPTASFQADNGNPTGGGKTVNGPNPGVEYYLIAVDNEDGHEYPDDPKLIIGTGGFLSQVTEQLRVLEKSAEELQRLVTENPTVKGTEAEEDLKRLREIIKKLKTELLGKS